MWNEWTHLTGLLLGLLKCTGGSIMAARLGNALLWASTMSDEDLRRAAEAGHAVVARSFGLPVGDHLEIADDGSGKTKIGSADHLSRIDQERTWLYTKMHRETELPNDLVRSLPSPFWPGCITNTSGCDFWKGQDCGNRSLCGSNDCVSTIIRISGPWRRIRTS
jgi:hypothetical protein